MAVNIHSLVAIFFIVISTFFPSNFTALAQEIDTLTNSIPTVNYTNGQHKVPAPDWSKVTFNSFPPIEEQGKIELKPNFVKILGYDPSRIWQVGTSIDQILMLGDVRDAFHLEVFNLKDISNLTGLAMQNLNLQDFGLVDWQTPKSLIKAIPQLGSLSLDRVAPIKDLWRLFGGSSSGSIGQIVRRNPTFGNLPLGRLNLRGYSLQSIPGLAQTAIGNFSGWQQSFVANVPGLSSVPFSDFPLPLVNGGISVAMTDIVWSDAERGDSNIPRELYISGTVNKDDKTVPVACETAEPCAYIELSDPAGTNGSKHGKRWVSGKSQKVKGGFGPLKIINGGWEPTGIEVYPKAPFKVVLTNVDETTGTAKSALYFHACASISFRRSCTPRFIGPIPWFSTREKGLVIVAAAANPNVNIPSKYRERIAQIEQQYEPQHSPLKPGDEIATTSTSLCGLESGGVDFKALADATSGIEGNYNSVGKWGCDSASNCGRGLGRYQLMTYRSDVRQAIQSQRGGQQFYARLASGYNPSTAELNQYFSPSTQDRLFANAQTQNINQLLRRGASGEGLVACLGQMWYSGTCSNSNGRDYTGGPTIREYGQILVRNYRRALQKQGVATDKDCGVAPPQKY